MLPPLSIYYSTNDLSILHSVTGLQFQKDTEINDPKEVAELKSKVKCEGKERKVLRRIWDGETITGPIPGSNWKDSK